MQIMFCGVVCHFKTKTHTQKKNMFLIFCQLHDSKYVYQPKFYHHMWRLKGPHNIMVCVDIFYN